MGTNVAALPPLVPCQLNPPLNYTVITDLAGLDRVRDYLSRASVFALDTETNMTNNLFYRRCRTIQLGDRNEQYIIDLLPIAQAAGVSLYDSQGYRERHACMDAIAEVLRPALESGNHLKVGHNLKFDYQVLRLCFGLRMWNLYDTMYAEKVLHAGVVEFKTKDFWALDDCVARYAGVRIDKSQQTTFDLEKPLTDEQIVYCALDCRLPLVVKNGQRDKIIKANLMRAVQLENDSLPAFADLQINGLKINEDLWKKLLGHIEDDHRKIIAKLDEFFVPVVGHKDLPNEDLDELERIWRTTTNKEERAEARKRYMATRRYVSTVKKSYDKCEGEAALNYGSQAQLKVVLKKMGGRFAKVQSTGDEVLKVIAEHPLWDLEKVKKLDPDLKQVGVIDCIRLYRETHKALSTYGEFINTYKNPVTGRVHSNIDNLGAKTGRTSSSDPNVQNFPHDSEWRDCFVAWDDSYDVITIDYNGCELRILAEYSREPVFLSAFEKGWDVHSVGAEIIFGLEWNVAAEPGCAYYEKHDKCQCKQHKELRNKVKAINFGIAYGMEAKKLAAELHISEDEASKLLAKYKASFPILIRYLDTCGKAAAMRLESRTLSNRRRLYPKPTWAAAIKKAIEKLKKKGKTEPPTTAQISSAFKGMFASIERQGKNTPIQGSNADMTKLGMGCGFGSDNKPFMWHELEPKYGAFIVNMVHDEVVIMCPKTTSKECMQFASECLSRAGGEFVKSIPMTTEGKISDRWSK